jgi:thiamine kinase-like enzyme
MSEFVRVATKAMKTMLGDQCELELVLLSSPGSSGARVSIFRHLRTGNLFAVKCASNSRISLQNEISRREHLVPHFREHLPHVLSCQIVEDYEVMISECRGINTLHQIIMRSEWPHERTLGIWNDIAQSLLSMWHKTTCRYEPALNPRNFAARLERIENGLKPVTIGDFCISKIWDSPVRVNNVQYPSLGETINEIKKIEHPSIGVFCHGDPQPSNFTVDDEGRWNCIDWEWSGGPHDWRMMLAHLYGWWPTRCLSLMTEPAVRMSAGELILEHDAFIPSHLHAYQNVTRDLFYSMATTSSEQSRATRDINRYLAALYLGEIRFLALWGREAFAVPMLAQAVAVVHSVKPPLPHQFQFNPNKGG